MRKHSGMRPQDIAILLKIVSRADTQWQNKDLARELFISQSEVSESLNRSLVAGLLNAEKKKTYKKSLLEFIEHGLHYVFPVIPGGLVNGVHTAHSHPLMKAQFKTEFEYVWPEPRGAFRGFSIEPLYKEVVKAIKLDEKLYTMLALIDVIRVGKVRERKLAMAELKKIIENES
jgi:hypothetical protein